MGVYGLLFGLTAIANLAVGIQFAIVTTGIGMVRLNLKNCEPEPEWPNPQNTTDMYNSNIKGV